MIKEHINIFYVTKLVKNMKIKHNYDIFLENMDKKFNKTITKQPNACESKYEIDKFVSLINENYDDYQSFFYEASEIYGYLYKKPRKIKKIVIMD